MLLKLICHIKGLWHFMFHMNRWYANLGIWSNFAKEEPFHIIFHLFYLRFERQSSKSFLILVKK
uniref:Uncharacterized protein n=1 Tax=Arundo donax TaxID=35708 RepID=A0A0A8Y623_ARUDO